ncbi:MAG: hypothetical protein ACD_62C00244G0008 [uncultured bacterium]|nr:MAG: hypothetical protein ACD_62C00244G0008 [uncultured bacterium]HLD46138.1 4-hydroxythreonine-4-phosphate dehydrogenase PdxA [bacterium]
MSKFCPANNIAVTLGDPLGIGPEVCFKALLSPRLQQTTRLTLIGPLGLFATDPRLKELRQKKNILLVDTAAGPLSRLRMSPKTAGLHAFLALKKAVALIKNKQVCALVTGPISKENVKLAGFAFPGHTEFLCTTFNVSDYAMMLFNDKLRVVLTTIHIPLKKVSPSLTKQSIVTKLALTARSLRHLFGIPHPTIAVCGLNPHAGENSLFGQEEKTIITPAIKQFLKEKLNKHTAVLGPLSADTVFASAIKGQFDAVLCHYHDQGLIPIKLMGLEHAVNMTLGLPFVRTSPAHGTAPDIAGRNLADPSSMLAALNAAVAFTQGS